jgi:hypothetical protein
MSIAHCTDHTAVKQRPITVAPRLQRVCDAIAARLPCDCSTIPATATNLQHWGEQYPVALQHNDARRVTQLQRDCSAFAARLLCRDRGTSYLFHLYTDRVV